MLPLVVVVLKIMKITIFAQVLASFVNPSGNVPRDFESAEFSVSEQSEKCVLPSVLPELLNKSCLVPAIASYLRNDSGE